MNLNTLKNRFSYYFRFTVLFVFTVLVIYAPYFILQRSFVWEHDSYTQHLKAMIFISRWYRQTLRALLHFDLKAISTYSFSIGYGSDALTTLAYYGVGDPFYLLSALVPAKYIYLFYCGLILAKNYFSGLAMSALCRYRWPDREHDGGCLAGSLIYTFCGFALITCFGQPIFLNALIIFPLVLLGIEKVRDGRRPWLFIFSIFLATVSNFYFIVSIVLMAVLYALFRYFPIEKGALGRRFAQIFTMFAAGTVGVAMGGMILVPMAITVLGNKRIALNPTINLFYDTETCSMLPLDFLACNEVEYGALCYAGTALLCVILLFCAKGFIKLRLQFLLYSVLLFIPAFGYLTNGFSYPINRWCWAYSALVAMIVAELWPRLFTLTEFQKRAMVAGLTLYFAVCFVIADEIEPNFLVPFIFTCITLLYLFFAQKEQFEAPAVGPSEAVALETGSIGAEATGAEATGAEAIGAEAIGAEAIGTGAVGAKSIKAEAVGAGEPEDPKAARRREARFRRAQRGILLLTIVGICANGVFKNYPRFNDRLVEYKDIYSIAPFREGLSASPANDRNMWINDMIQVADTIKFDGSSFVRASNTEPGFWYQNTSMMCGLSSTQSFWSVNSPYVLDYLDSLAVSDVNNNAWQFTWLDNRAILNELASVSYLYCMHPEKLPTGYSDVALDPETAISVYPNTNPLPLGYTYDHTISREQFDALSSARRQEILLTHAVVQTPGALQDKRSAEDLAADLECRDVPFRVSWMSETLAHPDDLTFVALEGGAQAELSFDPVTSGEFYINMKNVRFTETYMYDLYTDNREYDPDDLYTSEMFNSLPKFEQYQLYQKKKTAFRAKNIKITADFMNGWDPAATNELNYILPDDEQFYSGRQDFLLNSCTISDKVDSIILTFPVRGVYHFDEFSLVSEPLTTFKAKTEQLAANSLENVQINQNKSSFISTGVTGEITLDSSKLLCLTVPYSEGWKAYVDGSPAVLENVNLMFSGLWLSPGHHTIELRYETPGLLYGLCLSAAGFLLLLFWMIMSHRSGKRRGPEDSDADDGSETESDADVEPADESDANAGSADESDADAGSADESDSVSGEDRGDAPVEAMDNAVSGEMPDGDEAEAEAPENDISGEAPGGGAAEAGPVAPTDGGSEAEATDGVGSTEEMAEQELPDEKPTEEPS